MFFISSGKLFLFFDVWDGDGMPYAIQRFIASLPPWFKSGISLSPRHVNQHVLLILKEIQTICEVAEA